MENRQRYGFAVAVSFILAFLASTAVSGCGEQRVRVTEAGALDQLQFVRVGKTTRQEFYNRLGEPISEYEARRIIIYLLVTDARGRLRLDQAQRHADEVYNLVAVFGPNGVLERRNLVRVR